MEGAARILYRRYFALNALITQVLAGARMPSGVENCSEDFAQRRHDLRAAAFAFRTGETDELAGGAERDRKLDRFVEVASDQDRDLGPFERDVSIAGGEQNVADGVGAGHREGSGAARRSVMGFGLRNQIPDHLFRFVEPGVVLAFAPDHHRELAARDQALCDVAQRLDRAREEHHPEAREREVVRPAEISV